MRRGRMTMIQMNTFLFFVAKRSWIVVMMIAPLSVVYIALYGRQENARQNLQVHIKGENWLPSVIDCVYSCTGNSSPLTTVKPTIMETTTVKTANVSSDPVTIYVITPTYKRPTQMPDMVRLAYTLMHVPNIYWLVVEDATSPSESVTSLLKRTRIRHEQMFVLSPPQKNGSKIRNGKGVVHRLKALYWIRQHAKEGVIYFADDDNSYDIRLFEEMRSTQKVSVFPVGLIGTYGVSSPVVRNGKVVGFHDSFAAKRKFAMDMAGFAINVKFFLTKPKATFVNRLGYLEDSFLRSLGIKVEELEPKARNCTMVYVWHTKTVASIYPKNKNLKNIWNYTSSNVPQLYKNIMKYS